MSELLSGDLPRVEDGHFTILSGECEVLQFPDESVPQLKLLVLCKKKKFDEAKKLVMHICCNCFFDSMFILK